jgi:hypothetical protein
MQFFALLRASTLHAELGFGVPGIRSAKIERSGIFAKMQFFALLRASTLHAELGFGVPGIRSAKIERSGFLQKCNFLHSSGLQRCTPNWGSAFPGSGVQK